MMSLQAIRDLSDEIGRRARREGKTPWVPYTADEVSIKYIRHIPNIGSYVPAGWQYAENEDGDRIEWFVDKSGFGREDEPALTVDQFLRQLKLHNAANPSHGYAITEEGQFQLYVTAFRPKPRKRPKQA